MKETTTEMLRTAEQVPLMVNLLEAVEGLIITLIIGMVDRQDIQTMALTTEVVLLEALSNGMIKALLTLKHSPRADM